MATPSGGGNNPQLVPVKGLPDLQDFKFVEARVNGGVMTVIDSADIPPGAVQKALNARVRYDKTLRRSGTVLLAPVNSTAVVVATEKWDTYSPPNTSFSVISAANPPWSEFAFLSDGTPVLDRSDWDGFAPVVSIPIGPQTAEESDTGIIASSTIFNINLAGIVIVYLERTWGGFIPGTFYTVVQEIWNPVPPAALEVNGVRVRFAPTGSAGGGNQWLSLQVTAQADTNGNLVIRSGYWADTVSGERLSGFFDYRGKITIFQGVGTTLQGAADGNPVLCVTTFKKQDDTSQTYRLTPASVYQFTPTLWVPLTTSTPLHGTREDRIKAATILDTLVFTNNGADPIQKIDPSTNTYAQLGNAPAYRYVTGFFNRAVGAALRDTNEVQIGWSGDNNIAEWDPNVDQTAGSSPLIESPADLGDYIKGIVGFTNVMVVARERSLWYAIKQPSSTNPFYFISAVPGIGCNCPYSIALTLGGITWVDFLTRTAWFWQPGLQPERIGQNIEDHLFDGMDNTDTVFGSYDPINNEYTVCIPQTSSKLVVAWTYNFRTKAWVTSQYYGITSLDDIDLSTGGVTIDELVGTIDGLQGTIDGLSPPPVVKSSRIFGRDEGDLMLEDDAATTDAIHPDFLSGVQDASPNYLFDLISKDFVLPETDMYVAELVIEYVAYGNGSFDIQYSKTGGATPDDVWIMAKTIMPTKFNIPQIITYRKQVKSRRYAWRLQAIGGLFAILGFEVHVYPSGKSRQTGAF